MPFNLDTIKNLLKNKWALAGVAGVVGVGGFALYQRKKSTGSTLDNAAGTGAQDPTGGTVIPYGSGFMNSSGTDTAQWLSQWGGQFRNDLLDQTKSITDAINGHTTSPTTTPPATNPYPGTPRPTRTVTTKALSGDTWTTIVGRYFSHTGTPTTNAKALETWDRMHGGTGVLKPGGVIHLPVGSPGFLL